MNDEIKIIIDSIYREKQTNNLTITGWALNTDSKSSPVISIDNQEQVSSYDIKRVLREDVNQIYEVDSDVLAGFSIQLEGIQKKNKLEVRFISEDGQSSESEWIDLGKNTL